MEIDIEYLEKLSKLSIKTEEKEKFKEDFLKILEFVDEITKLDLPDEDKSQGVSLQELREDKETLKEDIDVLVNAPKKKDGCYQTPLVVE